jgi:hypothetical protein
MLEQQNLHASNPVQVLDIMGVGSVVKARLLAHRCEYERRSPTADLFFPPDFFRLPRIGDSESTSGATYYDFNEKNVTQANKGRGCRGYPGRRALPFRQRFSKKVS